MIVKTSKRAMSIRTILHAATKRVTFQLWDNTNDKRLNEFIVDGQRFSDENKAECFVLGVSNTCRDAGAKAQDVSIDVKFKSMKERGEYLEQGKVPWARSRVSDGSMLVRALVEVTGKSREVIEKFLEGKTAAQRLALETDRVIAGVSVVLTRLREEAGNAVDTDSLISELDGLE